MFTFQKMEKHCIFKIIKYCVIEVDIVALYMVRQLHVPLYFTKKELKCCECWTKTFNTFNKTLRRNKTDRHLKLEQNQLKFKYLNPAVCFVGH